MKALSAFLVFITYFSLNAESIMVLSMFEQSKYMRYLKLVGVVIGIFAAASTLIGLGYAISSGQNDSLIANYERNEIELQRKIETKEEGIKQINNNALTVENSRSKVIKLIQENQLCSQINNELLVKLEAANLRIVGLESRKSILEGQNQRLQSANAASCQKLVISGVSPNILRSRKKIINKGNFEIEVKECHEDDTKVTCYLSVINKGKKSRFAIHPAHSFIYDGSHNKFPASTARIANGIEKSLVSMVLHTGIQTSAQISFDNFTSDQGKIAVLEIYFVGSVGEFTNVSLLRSLILPK